jgi:diaminopimelate decarboxylase
MLLGTQRVNAHGHLEIGGCDTVELANEFGTPLYVMDESAIRDNCRRYRQAFESRYPRNDISFASKAYLNMAICKVIEQEGMSLDVASAGELYTAIRAEFPGERILLHGNNKSDEELRMGLDYGVGRIVVDNFQELRRLSTLARELGKTQKILLRVTPGIDPHTHRRIKVGQEDTKFGLSVANGDALEAITEALGLGPQVQITGVHCHIGSQLLDAHTHEQAIDIMVAFLRKIIDTTGWTPEDLDIGGGLGIRYVEDHKPPTYEEFADKIVSALQKSLKKHNVPEPKLWQEPGRAIVGETGTTLYTVGVIKQVTLPDSGHHTDHGTDPSAVAVKTYVTIDGGMSDNPRPQLYDAIYEAMIANKMGEPKTRTVCVAGKHCETDILIPAVKVGDVKTGDILAVQSTGAYNYAMASNYNRFTKPACVFVKDGDADLVSRRETLDDLVRLDLIPSRLSTAG